MTRLQDFIEQMLDVLEEEGLLSFAFDEEGMLDAGAEIVREVSADVLEAVPTPHNIRSEILQMFEALDPALQTALRLAAPLEAFSEAMLTDLGLPSRIVDRLAHLFSLAVDEGILESYSRAIPTEVLSADPSAAHAWSWRMSLLRQEVLRAMLASEVQRVERKMSELRLFHRHHRGDRGFPSREHAGLALDENRHSSRRKMSSGRLDITHRVHEQATQCELGASAGCCTVS